jgi:hypothetical protein
MASFGRLAYGWRTMKRDPRPVLQQVKSGLKIAGIILVVLASVMVCLSLLPIYRIEAWAWHLRHGNSIQVGNFQVPVPKGWLVQRFDNGDIDLINTVNTKSGMEDTAVVTVSTHHWHNLSIEQLESFDRKSLESIGVHEFDTRHFSVEGVSGFCLDGTLVFLAPSRVRTIECHIGTDFSVDYRGGSLNASIFYKILAGISIIH